MRTRFWRSLWDAPPASRRHAFPSPSARTPVGTPAGQPRVSIVVPVYNSARELRECLSALADGGADSEVIVVDDASTDESASVAAGMGATVCRLPQNSGPSAARNYGARQARADILFFVDADLVVMPGAVERVVALFDADPSLGRIELLDSDDDGVIDVIRIAWTTGEVWTWQRSSDPAL